MSRKKPPLNPVEFQKQVLVAESEINRLQLLEEWRAMTDGARSLAARAKVISAFASGTAILVAFFSAFWRGPGRPVSMVRSLIPAILKGAQVASSIWSSFRTHPRAPKSRTE